MNIMIVDDSEASVRLLERIVGNAGHRVTAIARDGAQAVEQYRKVRPDVVLMDVIMPQMNGMEALKAIRAIDSQARVVMACSVRSNAAALQSETLGARYFFFKPLQEVALQRVLSTLAQELADETPAGGSA